MEKPSGMWKCRACGLLQAGSDMYLDPERTAVTWTCSDLFCGGTCHRVNDLIDVESQNEIERKKKAARIVMDIFKNTGPISF